MLVLDFVEDVSLVVVALGGEAVVLVVVGVVLEVEDVAEVELVADGVVQGMLMLGVEVVWVVRDEVLVVQVLVDDNEVV